MSRLCCQERLCLSRAAPWTVGEGRLVRLKETIDEAYLICLTADHYPAVTTQVESYLQRGEGDPYPLAMSIFDLDCQWRREIGPLGRRNRVPPCPMTGGRRQVE